MHDIDSDTIITDHNLILVDIDDLRAAFGGEAASAVPGERAAAVPTTLMCPQW